MLTTQNAMKAIPLAVLLTLSGCASHHMESETIARAEESVKQAQDVGANEYAGVELDRAEEKVRNARVAFEDGDYERAEMLAEQAMVDAEYAETHTLALKAQMTVQEVKDSVRILREELSRFDRGE